MSVSMKPEYAKVIESEEYKAMNLIIPQDRDVSYLIAKY